MRFLSVATLLLFTVACGSETTQDAPESTSATLPEWEVDPTWPPTLPNDWILGDIRGLFVDDDDHLWVVHMPSSLTRQEIGAAQDPPIADCCFAAPPVLELDPEGNVLQAWGGPGEGYTWFDQEHGIYIDHKGFVWLGTSNGFHVMKFTKDGEHVLTIEYPEHFEVRKVSTNGGIRWHSRWINISSALGNEFIGLEPIGPALWQVYFGPTTLGWFDEELFVIFDTHGNTGRNPIC